MEWWEAFLLGLVQGLTEFLPVSSSGHLTIFREILGVDPEGFLDFTVTVHFATVLSTIVVFWSVIVKILKGLLKFRYNDEMDYFLKICVSMIPVAIVGLFFKDRVEALFGVAVVLGFLPVQGALRQRVPQRYFVLAGGSGRTWSGMCRCSRSVPLRYYHCHGTCLRGET